MRCAIGGFTLGILLLQQQSTLMSRAVLLEMLILAVVLLTVRTRINATLHRALLGALGALLLGWCWASLFALGSLRLQLPAALEERDLIVTGVVSSLPAPAEYGQRFQFQLEQVITSAVDGVDGQSLPKKILLNWTNTSANLTFHQTESTAPQPGERWQFNVRLRRPHGLANPHVSVSWRTKVLRVELSCGGHSAGFFGIQNNVHREYW